MNSVRVEYNVPHKFHYVVCICKVDFVVRTKRITGEYDYELCIILSKLFY